jgi:hypothetical protein
MRLEEEYLRISEVVMRVLPQLNELLVRKETGSPPEPVAVHLVVWAVHHYHSVVL